MARGEKATREIAGIKQRDPNTRLARSIDQRETHRIGVVIGQPAGCVMEIVELPDHGVAGKHHLGEDGPGQIPIGLRGKSLRHGIHLVAPGPEVATLAMGAPPQRAMEGVAVSICGAGQGHPAQVGVTLGPLGALDHLNNAVALDGDAHMSGHPRGQHRVIAEPGGHAAPPTQSRTTSCRASMPATQSSSLANSSGECEMPVGLRTKSMALRMP